MHAFVENHWHPLDDALLNTLPKSVAAWLPLGGKLTDYVKILGDGSAHIDLLHTGFEVIDGKNTFEREVRIITANKPVEWARSTIIEKDINEKTRALCTLGTHNLGEFLHQDPALTRSPFDIAKLNNTHKSYARIAKALEQTPDYFFARRSYFICFNTTLQLIEVIHQAKEQELLPYSGRVVATPKGTRKLSPAGGNILKE